MKVTTGDREVQLIQSDKGWIPAESGDYSITAISGNRLLIMVSGKPFIAECLEVNKADKTVLVQLNGQKHELHVKEPLDDLLHAMGLDKAVGAAALNIKAPMPGLVLDVAVEPGASVKKGEKVLVLEAMKMENVIKAGGDGVVARVLIQKGQTVDKNQVLIEFT